MKSAPDGPELLTAARDTVLHELVDALPEDRRYAARMAANAMAIAAREAAADGAEEEEELRMFEALYGEEEMRAAGATRRERLDALNRRFAKDIRRGVLDGACAQGVRALLLHQVRARLRVSNPRYLESVGLD